MSTTALKQAKENFFRAIRATLSSAFAKTLAFVALSFGWYPIYEGLTSVLSYLGWTEGFLFRYSLAIAITSYLWVILVAIVYLLLVALSGAYEDVDKYAAMAKDGGTLSTPKYSTEVDGQRFGLKTSSHLVECHISPDGKSSTTTHRTIVCLGKTVSQIEVRTTAIQCPENLPGKVELHLKPVKGTNTKLVSRVLKETKDGCIWAISFVPSLKEGERIEFSYDVVSKPGTFAMTEEAMRELASEYEFRAGEIKYPTELYRTRVEFPAGYVPQRMGCDVWMGEGRLQHFDEYQRARAGWRDGSEGNKIFHELSVEYPVRGLKYVLLWVPPKDGG